MSKSSKVVNLTSHDIKEVTTKQRFKASGQVTRVKASTDKVATHMGMPIYVSTFGSIEGLPDPVEGTLYIVSSLALNAVPPNRTDVVSPGNLQRDQEGKPMGCVGFRQRGQS